MFYPPIVPSELHAASLSTVELEAVEEVRDEAPKGIGRRGEAEIPPSPSRHVISIQN